MFYLHEIDTEDSDIIKLIKNGWHASAFETMFQFVEGVTFLNHKEIKKSNR